MPIPLLAIGALSAGSALASALTNRKRKQKQTSTTTSTPTFDPAVSPLLPELSDFYRKQFLNPTAAIEPLRVGARQKVNDAFSGSTDSLAQKFLGYGGGKSGKFSRAVRGNEMSRLQTLGGLESDFAQMALQQQQLGLSGADRLLQIARGTTQTGESETEIPGNMLGGGLGSGLETATFLYGLNNLMKGGNG